MATKTLLCVACTIVVGVTLNACAAPEQYHRPLTDKKDGYIACNPNNGVSECGYHLCVIPPASKCDVDDPPLACGCEDSALQKYSGYTQRDACTEENDPETKQKLDPIQAPYTLGFIEFDDQGLLYDRQQMRAVLGMIRHRISHDEAPKTGRSKARSGKTKNALIVAFMHGWKHSAAPTDCNVDKFKNVLARLSKAEIDTAALLGQDPRQVIGIYLGWRGTTLTWPWIEQLTFWDRKSMAEKVGHVGLAEVLTKLENVKNDANSVGHKSTRLIVIGHSFGAAAVYAALSQLLEARFIHSSEKPDQNTPIEGFGDLVVLINPAFEALSFTPLSDMSTERSNYPDSQLPVLAVLTSNKDYATKLAFPIGRSISTNLFDTRAKDKVLRDRYNPITCEWEKIDENKANVSAVGHFEPYQTHNLVLPESSPDVDDLSYPEVGAEWIRDYPGNKIAFKGGSALTRTMDSPGQHPYLVVSVDPSIIADHNDISKDALLEFIKQLILITSIPEPRFLQANTADPEPPDPRCRGNSG